jgi:exodeoxyribonuclease VII small subunit
MANFEERLTALEGVVERLERGDLSLEDSVKLFEEGLGLSNACKAELEAAEGKIQLLVDKGSGVMTARAMEIEGIDAGEDEE